VRRGPVPRSFRAREGAVDDEPTASRRSAEIGLTPSRRAEASRPVCSPSPDADEVSGVAAPASLEVGPEGERDLPPAGVPESGPQFVRRESVNSAVGPPRVAEDAVESAGANDLGEPLDEPVALAVADYVRGELDRQPEEIREVAWWGSRPAHVHSPADRLWNERFE